MSNLELNFFVNLAAKEQAKNVKDIKSELESYEFITTKEYAYKHIIRYRINMMFLNFNYLLKIMHEVINEKYYKQFYEQFKFLKELSYLVENSSMEDFIKGFSTLLENNSGKEYSEALIPIIEEIREGLNELIVKAQDYEVG